MIEYFKKLTKKQMTLWSVFTHIGYFALSIFAPVLTVCISYGLFSNDVDTKIRLGGWCIVLLLIAGVVSLFAIKKAMDKLDDRKPTVAYFKYTLKTISNLILPIGIICGLIFLKNDFVKACTTLSTMCGFYIAAGLVDGVLLSFIQREERFRTSALENREIEERKNLI